MGGRITITAKYPSHDIRSEDTVWGQVCLPKQSLGGSEISHGRCYLTLLCRPEWRLATKPGNTVLQYPVVLGFEYRDPAYKVCTLTLWTTSLAPRDTPSPPPIPPPTEWLFPSPPTSPQYICLSTNFVLQSDGNGWEAFRSKEVQMTLWRWVPHHGCGALVRFR